MFDPVTTTNQTTKQAMFVINYFFLILISLKPLHGLHCYSNGTYVFSRTEFQWTNFSTILSNLYHPTISNLASCHVRLTVNYNHMKTNYLTLEFLPLLNTSQTNIEFGTKINFYSKQKQITQSYFDYRCTSGNLCDKNFLNKWPKQILNSNNNQFHENILYLWQNEQICREKIRTESCESYLCFTIYNELKNLSYGKYQCEDQLTTSPINISVETYSGKTYQHYQCKKNQCTGKILYDSISEKNQTNYLNNTKYNKKQIDRYVLHQVLIIITVLLIIGSIAYCIQLRKSHSGYRLTKTQSV